jgi:hypothetical protein
LMREIESNDLIREASVKPPICSGVDVMGAITLGDSGDMFRIEVGRAGQLNVRLILLDLPPGSDYDLYVYRPSGGDYIARSNRSGLSSEEIRTSVDLGRYYIQVWPQDHSVLSDHPYRLHWRLE